MKDAMFQLNISSFDAVLMQGQIHYVGQVTDDLATLQGQLNGQKRSFTHAELADLIDQGLASIEYGYFSDRQAARRARAGRSLLTRLPKKTQMQAFAWETYCRAIEEGEQEGWFSRSSRRWSALRPKVCERYRSILDAWIQSDATVEPVSPNILNFNPSRTRAMAMLRAWEESRDPMVFVKKSVFNGKNAKRIHRECEAILQAALEDYLHPNRIFPSQVLDAVNSEVRRRNVVRENSGGEILPEISKSTVERRIQKIDKFEVLAAREGVAKAKSKLGAHGGGLQLHAPLLRVEMDEWEIDLMAILTKAGVDISSTALRDLELGRYWLCAALDTATRSILGIKLSVAPSAEDAKAVLWMAMKEKSKLAKQLGCEGDWKQHGHIYHVAVDNGAAFVNAEFKAALSDLGIDYSVLPAGEANLRGHIERLFRSIATLLVPFLTGRTFSNPQDRGDYPSGKYVVHTAESIIELLLRFTVDVYHNRKHRSLQQATPNLMWDRLVGEFGWSPAMSKHKLRHILGTNLKRDTGRHGVLVNGVNYHSETLAKHFMRYGSQTVDVSIDPQDMGYVSVWLERGVDSGWYTLKSRIEGLDDVSFAAWERQIFELRQANREAASLTQGVVDRAIARIKEIDAEQSVIRQLGPINLTQAQIRRAQTQTFWGLSLGHDFVDPAITDGSGTENTHRGLLDDEITYKSGPPLAERPATQPLPETAAEEWFFSDELDETGAPKADTEEKDNE